MRIRMRNKLGCWILLFVCLISCQSKRGFVYIQNSTDDNLVIQYKPYDSDYTDNMSNQRTGNQKKGKGELLISKPTLCSKCSIAKLNDSIIEINLPKGDSVGIATNFWIDMPAIWVVIGDVSIKNSQGIPFQPGVALLNSIKQIDDFDYKILIDSTFQQNNRFEKDKPYKINTDQHVYQIEQSENDTFHVSMKFNWTDEKKPFFMHYYFLNQRLVK